MRIQVKRGFGVGRYIQAIKLLLIKALGYRLLLILGDTLVLDRYLWLKRHLPKTRQGEKLLDAGCGSGAFTLAAAARGYCSTGISWDERNQDEAEKMARISRLEANAGFKTLDIRQLDGEKEFAGEFEFCINFENIEHIIDDRKLMVDIYSCLKPGGILLFTSPYFFLSPISTSDTGPFSTIEDGGHVRRGYTRSMLRELCEEAGFQIEKISGCSGYFSQKITRIYRAFFGIHPLLAWMIILPLRPLPLLLDTPMRKIFGVTDYSICMVAVKPRFVKD